MADITCSRNTSFAFYFIFFGVFIVALATDYWVYIEDILNTDIGYRFGLWKHCGEVEDSTDCESLMEYIEDADIEMNVTRGLMCGAGLFYLISFILYCAWMCKDETYLKQNGAGSVGKGALAMAFLGALFNLGGVILFGIHFTDSNEHFHFSFFFAVISGGVIFLNSLATLGATACCYYPSVIPQNRAVFTTDEVPHQQLDQTYATMQNYTDTQLRTQNEQAPVAYPMQSAYSITQSPYLPQTGAPIPAQNFYSSQQGLYQQTMPKQMYPQQGMSQYTYDGQKHIGLSAPMQQQTQASAPPQYYMPPADYLVTNM